MLTSINPKLPMRDKATTRDFYLNKLGFQEFGSADFDGYLMVEKDNIQIHFFEFKELDPAENYGQVSVSYTHLRAHETVLDLVCRLLLEKKNKYLIYIIMRHYIETS